MEKRMEYQLNTNSSSEPTELFPAEPIVYGSFGERFAAALLDGLILIIPSYLLRFLSGDVVGSLLGIVMSWLYAALQESGPNQATIGKKAVGMKVVNTEGQPVSFAQASGRHFGKYISMIIIFIGYLMMLWDERKQTLHDKMADTLIIKKYS
ncbi:MAG: RDD family protein [Bacteroidota bacterium]